MSEAVERYLQAGTRENTRRSYQAAVEHFEQVWGGFLPATSDSVARYLAHYGPSLSISTLKLRLAALAQWHLSQGFPDPTKAPLVRQVLKGIRATHPSQSRQAQPLGLNYLEQCSQWLEQAVQEALLAHNQGAALRHQRDLTLLLLGFWRGFRSDELCRLRVEHIQLEAGVGLRLYLPQSKGDRQNQGQWYQVPALRHLCPVKAYQDWLMLSGLTQGPVLRAINRWGHLGVQALHPGSLAQILRQSLRQAGIPEAAYSSHSLRRGFATWAIANGWDVKALMQYIGWKDVQSAMRYVDSTISFGALAHASIPSRPLLK